MRLWQIGMLMSLAAVASLLLIVNMALSLENQRLEAAVGYARLQANRGASATVPARAAPVLVKVPESGLPLPEEVREPAEAAR